MEETIYNMPLPKHRILLTGAGGFIGSHLAQRLVELGAAVLDIGCHAGYNRQ